jgi:hypothetical protein
MVRFVYKDIGTDGTSQGVILLYFKDDVKRDVKTCVDSTGILFASLNPDRSEESYVPYSTHGYPSPIGLNPAGSGQAVPANPGPHPSD